MWVMSHQSILCFVPLIMLSCAPLSVAHGSKWFSNGNPALNTNLENLKTYILLALLLAQFLLVSFSLAFFFVSQLLVFAVTVVLVL